MALLMALLMPPHGTADTTSWHHLAPLGTSHNITWCPKVPRKIVYLNNLEMVKMICESTKNGEEDIAFKIVNGYNALHLSAYFGHLDIVKYFCGDSKSNQKKLELIRMGVEKDGKGEKNAYELAAKSGNDEVSDYLEQFFDGHITELKKQLTKFVRQH